VLEILGIKQKGTIAPSKHLIAASLRILRKDRRKHVVVFGETQPKAERKRVGTRAIGTLSGTIEENQESAGTSRKGGRTILDAKSFVPGGGRSGQRCAEQRGNGGKTKGSDKTVIIICRG